MKTIACAYHGIMDRLVNILEVRAYSSSQVVFIPKPYSRYTFLQIFLGGFHVTTEGCLISVSPKIWVIFQDFVKNFSRFLTPHEYTGEQ